MTRSTCSTNLTSFGLGLGPRHGRASVAAKRAHLWCGGAINGEEVGSGGCPGSLYLELTFYGRLWGHYEGNIPWHIPPLLPYIYETFTCMLLRKFGLTCVSLKSSVLHVCPTSISFVPVCHSIPIPFEFCHLDRLTCRTG